MAGLYIHIPFCKQACHYCDFHFSTHTELVSSLCQAIAGELALQKKYLKGEDLTTLYLGGGTPSMIPASELENIFSCIYSTFKVQPSAEITLEANPDDLTIQKLNELKNLGVNRLSIGIQSFDDATLKFLNRAHNSEQALESVHLARAAGFDHISIDLIYSIPGQHEKAWQQHIQQAIQLSPTHLSAYALTIEEKTVFGSQQKKGKFKSVPEETSAHEFEILMDAMDAAGYEHYEISNFCKPGHYSRHNTSYWQQVHYLGVGPSAHSFDGVSRQFNVSNNYRYIKSIQQGEVPFEREVLTRSNQINEFIFTSLRTQWGCDLKKLEETYGYNLQNESRAYLSYLLEHQFASLEASRLKLTRQGKLLADKISAELLNGDESK